MNMIASRMTRAAAALVTIVAASILAGCPQDDSASMIRQIQAQGKKQPGQSAGTPADGGSQAQPGGPGAGANATGGPGSSEGEVKLGGPAKANEPQGAAAGETPAGPKFEVELKDVKAPYPRFSGSGYYDFNLVITAQESIPVQVWSIQLLDANGKVVGKDQQMLVLALNRPKIFSFRKFYCASMPVEVKLELTDKKAEAVPGDGEEAGSGKKGAGPPSGGPSGGGSATPGPGGGSGNAGGGDEGEDQSGAGEE